MTAVLRLDVRGVPEVVWQVRHACAEALRAAAATEASAYVAARLRAVAADVESGAETTGAADGPDPRP